MTPQGKRSRLLVLAFCTLPLIVGTCPAQTRSTQDAHQFGPVVSAYLGYLRNEQEVVDDRVSRREISRAYYRRNSNRIRALREIAIRIATESHNDYLPELEAVTVDELGTLFEHPPKLPNLQVGKLVNNTFRFLGAVRTAEVFYVFARLDPYEQSESRDHIGGENAEGSGGEGTQRVEPASRPRRVRVP
jgi:hypothetical protein